MVWTSIVGSDTLITVVDDENEITGLYDGLYLTGSGWRIGDIYLQLLTVAEVSLQYHYVEICQLEFYNIFTPNGDGDNELFRILGHSRLSKLYFAHLRQMGNFSI